MDDLDYTVIKLDNFDLIIITINQDSWNNIDKLKKIYKFIKENKYADFRLMMDNNQTNTISAELNGFGLKLITGTLSITASSKESPSRTTFA